MNKLYVFFLSFSSLFGIFEVSGQTPVITSLSNTAAAAKSLITIQGTGFSSTPANNTVWFGGVKGTVTAASTTELTVRVPPGAGRTIRVYSNGLMTESPVSFQLTFNGTSVLNSSSFGSFTNAVGAGIQNGSYNGLPLNSSGNLCFADLDGDGKPDMINGRAGIYLQHNTSTLGSISIGTINNTNNTIDGASFETRNNGGFRQSVYTELNAYQTNAAQEGDIVAGDIDGDGKIDIVSCVYRPGNTDRISIFRNITSAPGSLRETNFASPVVYNTSGRWARRVRLADFDQDGRLDILISTYGGGGSLLRNTSTPGSISFETIVNLSLGIVEDFIEAADIDGDGKMDIVARPWGNSQVKVIRNTSTGPGVISFAAASYFNIESGGTNFTLDDIDNDGRMDILASGNNGKLYILRNTSTSGSVTFEAFHTINTSNAINIQHVTSGDLDGDGLTDIAFTDGGYQVYVIKNNSTPGNLQFSSYHSVNPSGGLSQYVSEIVIQDIDGNGQNDIVSLSTYSNGIHLFGNSIVALPVSWLSVTARAAGNDIWVEWSTSAEDQNRHFEVERSIDGIRYETIGTLPGNTTTQQTQSYKWPDVNAPRFMLWYRIKQVDLNGAASYSKVVRINNQAEEKLSISPNPVSSQLLIQLALNPSDKYQIRIFDFQGRMIYQQPLRQNSHTVSCAQWRTGLYRVMIYKNNLPVLAETVLKAE